MRCERWAVALVQDSCRGSGQSDGTGTSPRKWRTASALKGAIYQQRSGHSPPTGGGGRLNGLEPSQDPWHEVSSGFLSDQRPPVEKTWQSPMRSSSIRSV